jgi:integrase/recombinase XerD
MTEHVLEGEILQESEHSVGDPSFPVAYVSGENVPGKEQPRRATTSGRELVPVVELTQEEILARFRAWMRLEVADGNGSEETIRGYFCDVRQHLAWLKEIGLSPATAGELDLKEYRACLVDHHAVTTVQRKLTGVRRFYQMAQARGLIQHDPAVGLKAPRDKTERSERVKYLTQRQLIRLLGAPNRRQPKGKRDLAVMVLMAIHGLRVIEVHRLDLEDVDPEAGDAGTLRVLGKGDKHRTILLTKQTRHVLGQWLEVRQMAKSNSQAIFTSMHWGVRTTAQYAGAPGERMSRRAIRRMVNGYLEQIGVRVRNAEGKLIKGQGISCHSLRHSYATHALANGANLLAISGSMGHSSVTTTQVYAKIVDRARHNPAKFLIGLLEDDEEGAG